jgi:hypothetical protein
MLGVVEVGIYTGLEVVIEFLDVWISPGGTF